MGKLYKIIVIIIFCIGILGITDSVFASYFGYSTWYDADKNWDGQDTYMCWAAAASNILAWGSWGMSQFDNEDKIFTNLVDHWTNQGSLMHVGWNWWFNGEYPSGYPYDSDWSTVDVSGGGNYWPGYNVSDYYHGYWAEANAMSKVDEYLHAGYGTTLAVYAGGSGHALTVWGYEYLGSDYQGVYVTDSDDHASQLAYYPVSLVGSEWGLGGAYSGWHIGGVEAFAVNPEPVSSLLFLLGGGLLAARRLRKKK
ncbi:MAG: PEP-CTERM sorting domain-containing protein [Candidatus Omnitrophota bacterium]|nr:PEP-CTERM sorting domain-containing protein [Candidatus Omnitrophota bacterium]